MLGKNPPQKPIGVYIGSMLIIIGFGIVPFLPTLKVLGDTWGSSFGALPFNGRLDVFYRADSDPSLILVFFYTIFETLHVSFRSLDSFFIAQRSSVRVAGVYDAKLLMVGIFDSFDPCVERTPKILESTFNN